MKFRVFLISLLIIILPVVALAGVERRKDKPERARVQRVEQTMAVDPLVTVSLCIVSGSISVHGWNKNEVLARSSDVKQIRLTRPDGSGGPPATRLTVLMGDPKDEGSPDDCQAFGDVEMMVPNGALVHVQTGDGSINISEVASVYAKSQTGDIEVTQASKSVEAVSFSGDVWVRDSTGRMVLKSVGGSLTATGARPADSSDFIQATTVSGDIELDQTTHAFVTARSVNGEVHYAGPLSKGGQYAFNTTKGDITLSLPAETSFRLNARVSQDADVTSDFPVTLKIEPSKTMVAPRISSEPEYPPKQVPAPPQPPQPSVAGVETKKVSKVKPVTIKAYTSRRVTAVHGSGNAIINVVSFAGSLRLIKESQE
ncbi:MAG: DUF4097 domain-containing protein [Pyrinomonadaceae bacterium]